MRAVVLGAALMAGAVVLAHAPGAQAQGSDDPTTGPGARTAEHGGPAPEVCRGSPTGYYSSNNSSQSSPFFGAGGAAYSYAGYGGSYSPYEDRPGPNAAVARDGTRGGAATSRTACITPLNSPGTSTGSSVGLARAVLAGLPLPSTTSIQRGADLRDPDVWLIQTRDGPVIGRGQPDGRYAFFAAPQFTSGSATAWRPWSGVDRSAVETVWQHFAAWWTDHGRSWPPR